MTFLNRVLHLINEARFKKSKDHPQPKETQHEFDYAKFLKVTPKASQEMRKFIRHGGAMGYDVADPRGSRTRRIFKRNESSMNYIQRICDLLVEAIEINEVSVNQQNFQNSNASKNQKGGKKYTTTYGATGVKGKFLSSDYIAGQRTMGDATRKSNGLPKLNTGSYVKRIKEIIKRRTERGDKGITKTFPDNPKFTSTSYTSRGHNPKRRGVK